MKTALWTFIGTTGLAVLLGPVLIPLLRVLKFGQTVRSDGPKTHLRKAGTPTMGGLIFIIPITLVSYYFGRDSVEVSLALVALVGYGLVGFADDFIKVVMRRSLGLKARHKLSGEIALGLVLSMLAMMLTPRGTAVSLFSYSIDLGWFYPFFGLLVLVATTNTVNLTDGLDGLAAGTMLFAALGYAVISWFAGHDGLTVFSLALAGGCLGFLVYNRYPAKVFMGDTGSLALGGALGMLAILTGTELLLFIIGGIFVAEALSVIIQVLSFRFTGRRVFRMSPLHHHFELSGWHETKVVAVFWLVGSLLAVAAVGVFLLAG
ncbi:MAG TPA: phospho-N-acetylmuramoyl-pentapeptide-transferase [Clostridia bacterium]|nr:phospho-N-acetylmuramoyl-pentapeptide-transferase [Clostridia bacterium]